MPVAAGEGAVEAAPVRPHPLVLGVNLRVQHGLQEGGGWTQGGTDVEKIVLKETHANVLCVRTEFSPPPPMIHDSLFYLHYTENLKHIFPVRKLHGLVPNFYIHVSVSDLYIPTIGPRKTDRWSMKIAHRYMNAEIGRQNIIILF
jgi:hypothetical protein